MAFSNAEINRISGSKLAVQGRQYVETNGDIWIGTSDNRLKLYYTKDVTIGVELQPTDPVVNLKQYIIDLIATSKAGHIIEDERIPVTQRKNLNFTGASVTVVDNGVTLDETEVKVIPVWGSIVPGNGIQTQYDLMALVSLRI